MAAQFGKMHHLLPPTYKRLVASWLEEDCPSFDYGGFVVGQEVKEARLLGKSPGMLAGVPFFNEVFRQLECTYVSPTLFHRQHRLYKFMIFDLSTIEDTNTSTSVEWHIQEGETFKPVKHCATVRGPINKILLGERVALNTLARCSGIATKTSSLLTVIHSTLIHSTVIQSTLTTPPPTLAGTRKTTPGFRIPEKYALLVGGADPHRHDLSSMTMLKDNHIWACNGDITSAVRTAKAAGGFSVKVEVECQSEAEAVEAVRAGADVVMLDNFRPGKELEDAVGRLRARFSDGDDKAGYYRVEREEVKKEFLIEVSGGLTEENVKDYVCRGVDIISTSSIHQGVKHVDFSLKVIH
ncbi:MAG: hypothetical protein Q9171_002159 [Xanthocarpia ochracea]